MIAVMIIGLVVLALGKVKVTRAIVLTGKRARWYGLTLFLTAIPGAMIVGGIVSLFFGGIIAAIAPDHGFGHFLRLAINYGVLITYMVLLALPFLDRTKPETTMISEKDAQPPAPAASAEP